MIATVAFVIIGFSIACNGLFAALIVVHRRRIAADAAQPPHFQKVSIVLTLRNLDDGLEENLVSVLSTDYPDFDVFFAVDGPDDPCVPVLERVRARFPQTKTTVVFTGHPLSGNPKIAKLASLEKGTGAPLLWVLDSDVRVTPHTLAALVSEHTRRDARIVFSPVRCRGGRTFGSVLEMCYVNFFLAGSVLAAWQFFRQRVVVGKSLLIDRMTLDRFGGFAFFSDVLAEDHWLGESFSRSGFQVRCNCTWVDNIKETTTLRNFFSRMERWAKLRYNLKRGVYLLEILFNPLALTLLFIPVLKLTALFLLPGVAVLRIALEYLVFFAVNDSDRNLLTVLSVAPAALVKDGIMFFLYFVPFFSRTVNWRSGRIRIGKDTRIVADEGRDAASRAVPERPASVVAVLMGMGHLRAAWPLRHLGAGRVMVYGSEHNTPAGEYRIWRTIRDAYYLISRAGDVPFFGRLLTRAMLWLQRIDPYYPRRDSPRPNGAVRHLERLIRRRGLCRTLVERVSERRGPVIHTYFATAFAVDHAFGPERENYLVICDADINRVWVPIEPQQSRIRYLVPCGRAKSRLLAYGVPEERIFLTGFPLPKENVGSERGLEVLKSDFLKRLLRLDPAGRFFRLHRESVRHWLDRSTDAELPEHKFTVTFAIGGAGAQTELAFTVLKSLSGPVREGRIRFFLSIGIEKRIFEKALRLAGGLGLSDEGGGFRLVFDPDPFAYLDKFNACLRSTDVLWTKPSELSFYCGLGLPVLLAPAIGTHEELNREWLLSIHAGVEPPGPVEYCREWLFDLRDSGQFAEAALDGFLKARKLGTCKIERLITQGTFEDGDSPLNR
jgi:cellulose synthase/poly-beta-1,6-N-acetylglucosamine synthase-like glycosyltransferase